MHLNSFILLLAMVTLASSNVKLINFLYEGVLRIFWFCRSFSRFLWWTLTAVNTDNTLLLLNFFFYFPLLFSKLFKFGLFVLGGGGFRHQVDSFSFWFFSNVLEGNTREESIFIVQFNGLLFALLLSIGVGPVKEPMVGVTGAEEEDEPGDVWLLPFLDS